MVDIHMQLSAECREAINLAKEVVCLCEDLPPLAEEWGDSVVDTAEGILLTIETNNVVTEKQFQALENLKDGVEKWLGDE